jgi:hypothetical protein
VKDIRRSHERSSVKLHKTDWAGYTREGRQEKKGSNVSNIGRRMWKRYGRVEKNYIITGKHCKVRR